MQVISTLSLMSLVAIATAVPTTCRLLSDAAAKDIKSMETTYMLSFGDSYSQTGFNLTGDKPSAKNPIGNPPLPGWTASGGYNWVGFAASTFNDSTLLSYNLAYGGATTASDLVKPFSPEVKSFQDQVGEFSAQLASKPSWAPWTANNTLVAVWIGVNDVGNSFWGSDTDQLYEKIMVRYFAQLKTLYDAGVRQFALLGTPPIGRTPSLVAQGQSASGRVTKAIAVYNNLLSQHLKDFKAAHSDVKTWLIDTTASFNKALDAPTQYGAPDATCYNGDGKSCLWFNDYHPGVAIQKLVAQKVATTVGMPFFKA
ncbi:SGNH hydrolase superfamily [Fusarium oxysporum f. sp. vasinfectum]|uniref:Uncharacterized protein n=1 Tax=Fusarium oxysporum f. sp. vasinfectum 25433 TaxID=1089449 RepID=X0L0E0_FUSOX|nr:hypothetical protein FOTG_17192 [Fusarium oxysporum f. sp. vasinfectum 25433]KAK2670430.1 SGNH hydrolase superfamily [Fusarium oxysporum f. sp. vasinfectum]KAK2926872.1 SGNH hydrolase superfamily [Fusarium oxysporum f. sp. vasinfectum]